MKGINTREIGALPIEQRIARFRAAAPDSRGCILWTGYLNRKGYGLVRIKGRTRSVPRLVLEIALGRPIRKGLLACHHCDTPACINADHLYEGTALQNTQDAMARKRLRKLTPKLGIQNYGAKITERDAIKIRAAPGPLAPIGNRYGLSTSQVSAIKKGKAWAYLSHTPLVPARRHQ